MESNSEGSWTLGKQEKFFHTPMARGCKWFERTDTPKNYEDYKRNDTNNQTE